MNGKTFVCRVEDSRGADDEAVVVRHAGIEVAVFHVGGEWFALADRCPHQGARLSQGFLDGYAVECPIHASMFDLRTGQPSGPPAAEAVSVYRTEVCDGAVWIAEPVAVS